MNRECNKMRADIERSAFKPVARERQDEIDGHVARCAACREYLEAMREDERALTDFTRSVEPAIERIERESVRAAACGAAFEPDEHARTWGGIMKSRIAVYAAAAVALVAVLWGLNHYTGLFGGEPAFADVMAKVNKAENVSYRQVIKMKGEGEFVSDNMATAGGVLRYRTSNGLISIIDFNKGLTLGMDPAAKTAYLTHRLGRPAAKGLFNYVDWVATLQNVSGGAFAGRERLGEKEANVFDVIISEYSTIKVWTNPATNLPLRIVWTSRSNPGLDVAMVTLTLSEGDFGGDSSYTSKIGIGSSNGMQPNSESIFDNFKWNEKFDPALFSMTPPKDYAVRESQLDVSDKGEKDLVDALSAWAKMSERSFPAQIADLTSEEKVRPMLIKRYDKNGEPGKELEEAMGAAHTLLKGLNFSQDMKAGGDWYYAGAGVKLGDRKTPVCWWKPEGSLKYRILYGDLRVTDIDEADLPKTPR